VNLEWKRSLNLWLLLAPGVGFLLVFFGSPLALAVLGGFGLDDIGSGEIIFTLEHYRTMLTDRIYLYGLGFTLYLSLASTLLSLLIALPVTALLQRSFPGQRLFNALYKVPLIVPGVVAAFLVLTLADRGGLLPRVFERVGLGFPQLVRDRWALGVLIGMAWKSVPFMVLVIGGSMAAVPRDVLAASRTLGANFWQTFLRVQVPLALPGITAASLLVFIGATGAYAIPNLIGPVYPSPISVHMYENAFERNQWGLVAAMGTVLSLTSSLVLLAYYRLTRDGENASSKGA
jgi:putative spermidine/putrescine transport system permease protein